MFDNNSNPPQQPAPTTPADNLQPAPSAEPPSAAALMTQLIEEHAAQNADPPAQPAEPAAPDPNQPADGLGDPQFGEYDYPVSQYTEVVSQILAEDQLGAYDLGAAILSQMPDLLIHNRDYVLSVLGYDSQSVAQQAQEIESAQRADYAAAQSLSGEITAVFDEVVAQGKAAGYNDLEAAGLAAMAYGELKSQYWKGDGSVKRALDEWHSHLRGGNPPHKNTSRSDFRKAFGALYDKVAANHKPSASGDRPAAPYLGRVGDAADVMRDVMREHGVSDGRPNGYSGVAGDAVDAMNQILKERKS